MKKFMIFLIFSALSLGLQARETITISGRVTDFEGNPIDSCLVQVKYTDFSDAYTAYSDREGYYSIPGVEKGKYLALYALRPGEYPREQKVAEEDMRLEYWAWNVIADRDLTINPRYDKLELYGTTVFRELGGMPMMMIHTRPMSLGRMLSFPEEVYMNKSSRGIDIATEPDEMEFKVWADDVPLDVLSVHPMEQNVQGLRIMTYVISVDFPKNMQGKYCIFRLAAHNRAYGGEWGENAYFYEIPEYQQKP